MISPMEDNPALTAAVLKKASRGDSGISRLARELHIRPARMITLANDLRDAGLVDIQTIHARTVGRPLVRIVPTPLAGEYLRAYGMLSSKMLKSRPSDLVRAAADGDYARRLSERGLSPIGLFLELNSLVVPLRRVPS